MNDEHPHPEPDESRSSPAQPEDDIAALEREARARREAALLTMQEDEENDPVQPAINKLKKRRRGKATAFLALAAVALIGLAWAGNSGHRVKKNDRMPRHSRTGAITGSVPIWGRTIPRRTHQNRWTASRAVRRSPGRRRHRNWIKPVFWSGGTTLPLRPETRSGPDSRK